MATPVGSDGAPVNRLNDISDRVRDDLFDIRWPTRVIPPPPPPLLTSTYSKQKLLCTWTEEMLHRHRCACAFNRRNL